MGMSTALVAVETTLHVVRLVLPMEASSARRGRLVVRSEVAQWDTGVDNDQLDVLELLTSELITNCLLHAATPELEVTARHHQEGIRVSVSDWDSQRPLLLHDEHPAVLGGRGLILVHAFADDWGVDEYRMGKAIWFSLNHESRPRESRHQVPAPRRRL